MLDQYVPGSHMHPGCDHPKQNSWSPSSPALNFLEKHKGQAELAVTIFDIFSKHASRVTHVQVIQVTLHDGKRKLPLK
jgi:hypothetical protein